jgi:hypothetical protein
VWREIAGENPVVGVVERVREKIARENPVVRAMVGKQPCE